MKLLVKPKDVCPKDCQGRSATCHATCEIYREYYDSKHETYKAKEGSVMISGYMFDAWQRCKGNPPEMERRKKR